MEETKKDAKDCSSHQEGENTICKGMIKFMWLNNIQGMVDGSASKPALRQDTGYMVEKTYIDIAPYLMPQ